MKRYDLPVDHEEDCKLDITFDLEELDRDISEAMLKNRIAENMSMQHAKEFRTTPNYE